MAHCTKQGRAIYGEPEDCEGCVNRSVECVTCGRRGTLSENTEER